MNIRPPHGLRSLALAAVLASLLAAPPATAQQATKVMRLRTDKVTLFDAAVNGKAVRDFQKSDFKVPWKVIAVSPEKMLQVEVDGAKFWVRPYTVETDAVVQAPSECGAVVAKQADRIGATRGLGDECKP
jgi:hypothetical protein